MTAFIIGFTIGFAIAIPPGAIAVTAVSGIFKHGLKHGFVIGSGAAVMDAVYAAVAMFGIDLVDFPHSELIFKIVTLMLLVVVGIKETFFSHPNLFKNNDANGSKSPSGAFFLGLVMSLATPTFLPAWIIISANLNHLGLFDQTAENFVYTALGGGLGTLGWFSVLLVFVQHRKAELSNQVMHRIIVGLGVTLLLIGATVLYSIIGDVLHSTAG